MKPERKYHYSDIYLVPKKTIVASRKDVDTSVQFGRHKFAMPIVAANMKSVVNEHTCLFLAKHNLFYIMHRFDVDQIKFIDFMQSKEHFASISVGVNEDSYKQLREMRAAKLYPEYITVDIANIWSNKGEAMVKYLKDHHPESFVIAGNLATAEAALEVIKWGPVSLKIGIASGKICITKEKTGFHVPMVSSVNEVYLALEEAKINIPIIADGGILTHGDFSKSLSIGATMVMAGSMFSGYDQSAGDLIEIDGKKYKEYYGSASFNNKSEYKHVEGKRILIEYKGDMNKFLKEIKEDIASAVSYSGGLDLSSLRNVQIITDK